MRRGRVVAAERPTRRSRDRRAGDEQHQCELRDRRQVAGAEQPRAGQRAAADPDLEGDDEDRGGRVGHLRGDAQHRALQEDRQRGEAGAPGDASRR